MVIPNVLRVKQGDTKTSQGILLAFYVLQAPLTPLKQAKIRRQFHATNALTASTRWTALLLAHSVEKTFISPLAPSKTAAQPVSRVLITLNQVQEASKRHLASVMMGIRARTERRA